MLVSTGEQVSAALMAMLLNKHGCPARSYTGAQAGIVTDAQHKKARISDIRTDRLQADIKANCIPVVAIHFGYRSF